MELPRNRFKEALLAGRQQIGLWCTLSSAYAAEAVAGSGYDWLLFDTEHSPTDVEIVLSQLQAVSAYPVAPVVRPTSNEPVIIKRHLDIGVQTLLIPYVQTPEEAAQAVAATRYPPEGIRGLAAMTRATRFGRIPNYAKRAAEELCVIVQVETVAALEHLEAIAGTEGIDAVFIGPGDLAATMGFAGEPNRPEVKAVVEEAIGRLRRIGKPAGVLTLDPAFAQRCIDLGATFTAVALDVGLLTRSSESLLRQFRPEV